MEAISGYIMVSGDTMDMFRALPKTTQEKAEAFRAFAAYLDFVQYGTPIGEFSPLGKKIIKSLARDHKEYVDRELENGAN
jgi:hypothetical protein